MNNETKRKGRNSFERQRKSGVLFRHVNLECHLDIEVEVSGRHLDKYISRNINIKEDFLKVCLLFFSSFGMKPAFEHFLLAFDVIYENDCFNYIHLFIDMFFTRQG